MILTKETLKNDFCRRPSYFLPQANSIMSAGSRSPTAFWQQAAQAKRPPSPPPYIIHMDRYIAIFLFLQFKSNPPLPLLKFPFWHIFLKGGDAFCIFFLAVDIIDSYDSYDSV